MESVKLLRAMKLDPVELRGVGIQITKLDGEARAAEREAGQGTLTFGARKDPTVIGAKIERVEASPPAEPAPKEDNIERPPISPSDGVATDGIGLTSKEVETNAFDRSEPSTPTPVRKTLDVSLVDDIPSIQEPSRVTGPRVTRSASREQIARQGAQAGPPLIVTSSDGIDPEFLAALPPELRLEVKRDFARTRATSEKPKQVVERPPPPPESRAVTISPAKPKGMHATAHITRQLRPKVKTQLKAAAIADLPLYGAWAKATEREDQIDLTTNTDEKIDIYAVSELRELDIDPDVFRALPLEMQKEVVDEERRKHQQRKMLHRPADRSRYRSRERESTRTASLSPSRSSRAGSVPPKPQQRIAITRPFKPALLKATSLPAVLETVRRWIESRGNTGPAARDAGKVKTYLIKCMGPEAGFGGVENVVEVLKWMRTVLLETWEKDGKEVREAGKEWWATWSGFKEETDRISVERFGAPIRL